ncbi:hypothetical protein M3J09_010237 [Ascochyta lentis]
MRLPHSAYEVVRDHRTNSSNGSRHERRARPTYKQSRRPRRSQSGSKPCTGNQPTCRITYLPDIDTEDKGSP